MKIRHVLFGLLLALLLAVPVFADVRSWSDPEGSYVNGQTWLWEDSGNYWGNGRTWRNNATGVYRIWVRVSFWNDCGYYHEIVDTTEDGYGVDYVEVGKSGVGSDQCPEDMTFVEANGEEHFVRFYNSGGPLVGGQTYEKLQTN